MEVMLQQGGTPNALVGSPAKDLADARPELLNVGVHSSGVTANCYIRLQCYHRYCTGKLLLYTGIVSYLVSLDLLPEAYKLQPT